MEKQLKYRELLQKSSEDRKEEEIRFQEESAKLQLSSDILATEKSLANAKRERLDLLVRPEFDSATIIRKDVEIESLQDGIKRLKALQTDLF